jgi:rSAM/selenodomain-associated transferase 2
MNFGASKATRKILLFLHADSRLPPEYPIHVRDILAHEDVAGGAFQLRIDGKLPSLRLIETVINLRSRILGLPYGDQALFLAKATFHQLKGFSEIPIMEDFDFVRRLKELGRIRISSESVLTSARRWERLGPWKTTVLNQFIILSYLFGVSPDRLSKLYRRW